MQTAEQQLAAMLVELAEVTQRVRDLKKKGDRFLAEITPVAVAAAVIVQANSRCPRESVFKMVRHLENENPGHSYDKIALTVFDDLGIEPRVLARSLAAVHFWARDPGFNSDFPMATIVAYQAFLNASEFLEELYRWGQQVAKSRVVLTAEEGTAYLEQLGAQLDGMMPS
jgi:hypothetical protein